MHECKGFTRKISYITKRKRKLDLYPLVYKLAFPPLWNESQ